MSETTMNVEAINQQVRDLRERLAPFYREVARVIVCYRR